MALAECASCRFWDPIGAADTGYCRINPPTIAPAERRVGYCEGVWPATRPADWCSFWVDMREADE